MKSLGTKAITEIVTTAGLTAFLLVILVCLIIFPTNEMDNRNPTKLEQMEQITLKWGRLASFPSGAEDFTIWTEGSNFTRTFSGSFTSSPTAIENWIRQSPGLQEAEVTQISETTQKYIISPGGGASYAEVIINTTTSTVEFTVSWS